MRASNLRLGRLRQHEVVFAVGTLVTLVAACRAAAQEQPYAIPDAPAFAFLGTSPTRIGRPGTARELAVGLANGLDSLGRVQQGLALDFIPWHLIPGMRITLPDYQQKGLNPKYMLANTQLSVGTVRAAGDTASTDLAIGLRVLVHDGLDPMTNESFTSGLRAATAPCEFDVKCLSDSNKAVRARWFGSHWNGSSFAIAVAAGGRLVQSRLSTMRWTGFSVWAVGTLALWSSGELAYQLRYDNRPAVPDTAATSHTLSYGVRGTVGSPSVNGFVELLGSSRLAPAAGPDRTVAGWSGGIEFRAGDQLWLSTGFGNSPERGMADKVVLIANIRWSVAAAPRLSPVSTPR